jgi:hypothetical protein
MPPLPPALPTLPTLLAPELLITDLAFGVEETEGALEAEREGTREPGLEEEEEGAVVEATAGGW